MTRTLHDPTPITVRPCSIIVYWYLLTHLQVHHFRNFNVGQLYQQRLLYQVVHIHCQLEWQLRNTANQLPSHQRSESRRWSRATLYTSRSIQNHQTSHLISRCGSETYLNLHHMMSYGFSSPRPQRPSPIRLAIPHVDCYRLGPWITASSRSSSYQKPIVPSSIMLQKSIVTTLLPSLTGNLCVLGIHGAQSLFVEQGKRRMNWLLVWVRKYGFP